MDGDEDDVSVVVGVQISNGAGQVKSFRSENSTQSRSCPALMQWPEVPCEQSVHANGSVVNVELVADVVLVIVGGVVPRHGTVASSQRRASSSA